MWTATEKYDISSLSYLSSGAAPLGGDLIKAAIEKLGKVGAKVDIAQGQSSHYQVVCRSNILTLTSPHFSDLAAPPTTGYGLTETSPVTHIVPRSHTITKMGSIGVLLPNLEARIVADSDANNGEGLDAKPGERGELWVRGPSVMKVRLHPFAFRKLAGERKADVFLLAFLASVVMVA